MRGSVPCCGEHFHTAVDVFVQLNGIRHLRDTLRFSQAGVQLKFLAVSDMVSDLTLPASRTGEDGIVKLPSQEYSGVPENEFSRPQCRGH